MSDDTSHYPTIMKLRTFESANKLLIKAYDKGHKTYLRNIKNKDFDSAQSNLDSLNQVNTQLINNLNSIKALLKKGISEGSVMQDIASASIPILNNTYKRANRQNAIINRLNKTCFTSYVAIAVCASCRRRLCVFSESCYFYYARWCEG